MVDNAATPRVSIVLPNLNYRAFLEPRFESILAQTFSDWELIVVDGCSDDGAWELIQDYAARDSRLRVSQSERRGIYDALNRGISQARGEYVYIATSDDTMEPDCLERMVAGLDAHAECGLCHCSLRVIDEQGRTLEGMWRSFPVGRFFGALMDVPHIRLAPHDGILHAAVYTVYVSLTTLLIRRSVFERVGVFREDWGSVCDFEWGMRASLVTSTLHLPEELATWRLHEAQATAELMIGSSVRHRQLAEMVGAALQILEGENPPLWEKIDVDRLLKPYRQQGLGLGLWEQPGKLRKLAYLGRALLREPGLVVDNLREYLLPRSLVPSSLDYIRAELERLGLQDNIRLLDRSPCE